MGNDDVVAVDVSDLSYTYPNCPTACLKHVNLVLPRGSICILVGANGSGKTTLLQILAGKKLVHSTVQVLSRSVFFSTPPGLCYLGTEWASNPVVRSDLVVSHFLDSVGGYRHKERRDRLLDIMDVDLSWRMHRISDGERRRVQIVAGLMVPWDVLLLDEVTVDLDVLVRSRLLDFLTEECKTRSATVVYATHIYDGLDSFPTHVVHLHDGLSIAPSPLEWPIKWPCEGVSEVIRKRMMDDQRRGSRMLELALGWLENDRKTRSDGYRRGPATSAVPSDSEVFYRKYDYSH